ncbi:MAG: hypothetical protein JWO38_4379 [Gemmataceae bacterium]|nr:hypothetical protein [Gemmataceae bacterium]
MKALHDSLTDAQRTAMCFDWDRKGYGGLPLRLHVTNNWAVSPIRVGDFTADQQALVEEVFKSVLAEGWTEKLAAQAKDDTGKPWTEDRKVAIFGTPGTGTCQCVISGFHLTFRAGRPKDATAAFGGAIYHGHQPGGFHEKPGHPGNIFWYQAREAHKLYRLLDGKQQAKAVLANGMPYYEFDGKIDRTPVLPGSQFDRPMEPDVRLRGPKAELPGLPITELARDQKEAMGKVLTAMLGPYREPYRDDVARCLEKQGGLDKCHLIFYRERTLGKDGEWDNWRVEGPAFVWYFRGFPHVHIWFHAAEEPAVPVTSHFG